MDLLDTQLYALIGDEGFTRLTAAFFRRVPADPLLAPMYQHDLAGAEWRLREFLVGRFGGPTRYIEQRGHPRLRMRHAPFAVTPRAREAMRTSSRCASSIDGVGVARIAAGTTRSVRS